MITTAQYATHSTPVLVASNTVGFRRVHLIALGNTTVFLGATNAVTTSTGYPVTKDVPHDDVLLGPGEELWAVSATSETLCVMTTD